MPRFVSSEAGAFADIDNIHLVVNEAVEEAAVVEGAVDGDVVVNVSQLWRDGIAGINQWLGAAMYADLSSVLPAWAIYAVVAVIVAVLLFFTYRTLRHMADKSKVA